MGTYTATLTVTNAANVTVTATVQVMVNAPLVGTGVDSDGDGFSDAFETSVGTSPTDATSTPTGQPITPASIHTLTLTKAAIKLNFAKTGKDSISFMGTLAVPAGFNPNGAKIYFDVSGVG